MLPAVGTTVVQGTGYSKDGVNPSFCYLSDASTL